MHYFLTSYSLGGLFARPLIIVSACRPKSNLRPLVKVPYTKVKPLSDDQLELIRIRNAAGLILIGFFVLHPAPKDSLGDVSLRFLLLDSFP